MQIYGQNNETSDFRFSVGLNYLSRFVDYGIDLSDESPAWSATTSLSHNSGLYIDGRFAKPTESVEDAKQLALDLGYEHEFSNRFSMYAEYNYYMYSSDTLHLFSEYSNSLSLNADIDLMMFDLGLSYDRFLGGSGASYFSIDISRFIEFGSVYLLPMLQTVFMSQEVEMRYLKNGKGKKANGTTEVTSTTVTGLSNTMLTIVTIYPLVKNVNLSFMPALIFYHNSDISADSMRFIWNIGVRYNLYL
jgi:hypothetical protein